MRVVRQDLLFQSKNRRSIPAAGEGDNLQLQYQHSMIEAIKQNLPIEQAAAQYLRIQLTRRGNRWVACCPFHQERTPSFTIFPDGGFKCFGCGEHGDVITLVAKGLHLDTAAAIKMLAADLGLQPDRSRDRQAIRRQIEANRLQQATVNAWESDFLRVFLVLVAVGRAIDALLRSYEEYFNHPMAVYHRSIIDDILDDLTAADQVIQIEAWRRARRLFPWLKE